MSSRNLSVVSKTHGSHGGAGDTRMERKGASYRVVSFSVSHDQRRSKETREEKSKIEGQSSG